MWRCFVKGEARGPCGPPGSSLLEGLTMDLPPKGPTEYPGYREERDAWSRAAKKLQNERKAKKRERKKTRETPDAGEPISSAEVADV